MFFAFPECLRDLNKIKHTKNIKIPRKKKDPKMLRNLEKTNENLQAPVGSSTQVLHPPGPLFRWSLPMGHLILSSFLSIEQNIEKSSNKNVKG